jgi:UDP-N-acetylmuramate dehydrogenase
MTDNSLFYNFSLQKFNSFGINVQCEVFAKFDSVAALTSTIAQADTTIKNGLLVLGGGSNILFTKNVKGLVVKNEISGIEKIGEDEDFVYIQAGAGVNWHQFVLYCIEHNWAGIENLALIPGCVGASPMQNIGAYGVEIKDVFHQLQAYNIKDKTLQQFTLSDCAFGYRESVFKQQYKNQFIITHVTFKLRKVPVFNTSYGAIEQELVKMNVQILSIKAIADAVINIRSSKLPNPAVIGNAGSFFKNPVISNNMYQQLQTQYPNLVGYNAGDSNTKLAAGWLIEQCGFKGYRKGDAGCHALQALVLVNYKNATGAEIYDLSTQIINAVQQKFGVTLQREVNII